MKKTSATAVGLRDVAAFGRDVLRLAGWRAVQVPIVSFAASLTAGATALALVPLAAAAGVDLVGDGASPRWLAWLLADGRAPNLESALAIYVALTGLQAALGWWQGVAAAAATQRVTAALRQDLFDATMAAPWVAVARRRATDLQEAMIRATERAGLAAYDLLTLVSSGVFAAALLVLAISVSPAATAVAAGSAALLSAVLAGRRRASLEAGERLTDADQALHRVVGEWLSGLKIIRAFNAGPAHRRQLEQAARALHRAHVRLASHPALVRAAFEVGAAVVLAGVVLVAIRGLGLSAAAVMVLVVLFLRLAPRLSSLQVYYHSWLAELPAHAAVRRVVDECRAAAPHPAVRPTPATVGPLEHAVVLEDVSFSYDDRRVLDGVTLVVPAGQTTALVGASGAGKSTIADLVLGLITPAAGRITIDGTVLGPETVAAWQARVGYVPQEPFLFHETIRGNLLWAAPEAGEDALWQALDAAAVGDVVRALPDGLDTVVGDRGGRLSGGERQRLAIARALLRRPALLVLDEATSALDGASERAVQRALDRLHGRTTVLVIAHRLSTIHGADRIALLEGGRIVDTGTWPELTARPDGRFRARCREQGLDFFKHDAAKGAGHVG